VTDFLTRDAFVRFDLDFAIEEGSLAFTRRSRDLSSHPFHPARSGPFPFKRRSCRVVLPGPRLHRALRPRSDGGREDASHRLLQPIVDTSTREPSDSRLEALASRNRRCVSTHRWRRDRLAASRLRVKTRSTTRLQLQPYRSSLVLGRGLLCRRLRRGVIDRARSGGPASDAPFRPPSRRGHPRCARALEPLPPDPRQRAWHSWFEAPSLDRCPTDPLSRPCHARHRSRGFATDEPASDALSPPSARAGWARPSLHVLFADG